MMPSTPIVVPPPLSSSWSVHRMLAVVAVLFVTVAAFAQEDTSREDATRNVSPPEGFKALFNGRDFTGWGGLYGTPVTRAAMTEDEHTRAREAADTDMRKHWTIKDGTLIFDGKGHSLMTVKPYRNFELLVDWRIEAGGDSGIYLRGSPQVQIWDRKEGSGGLYNNQKNPSKPLVNADKPVGEWNTFRIKMVGERVTVHLNGTLIVDNVVMENYWERDKPIYAAGPIELQSHGSLLAFKNIFVREIPPEEDNADAPDEELADPA